MPMYVATKYRKGLMGTKDKAFLDSIDAGAAPLDTITEKTAGAGVTADGVLLKDQNVVPVAGKGVDFAANTGAAGESSSLLDWYEEGTFTPTLTINGNLVTVYSKQYGWYTRIGNLVTIFVHVVDASSDEDGTVVLGGLPFTAKNNAYAHPYQYAGLAVAEDVSEELWSLRVVYNSTTAQIWSRDITSTLAQDGVARTGKYCAIQCTFMYIVE